MIFRLFQAFLCTVARSLSSSREAVSDPFIDPLIDPKDAQQKRHLTALKTL